MVSVAQLDRALGCGPSGRGFESLHSPHAPVAQLDRASDFESAGRPFESDRARHELCKVRGCRASHMVHGAMDFFLYKGIQLPEKGEPLAQ